MSTTDTSADGTATPVAEPASQESYLDGLRKHLQGQSEQAAEVAKPEAVTATDEEAEETTEETVEAAPGDDAGEAEAVAEESAETTDETADQEEEPELNSKEILRRQRAEKKFQAHIKTETERLKRHESHLASREEALTADAVKVQKFVADLLRDPFGTLESEGLLDAEGAEYVARQMFLAHRAQKDPVSKAEAERLRRERERDLILKKQREDIEALRKEREDERRQLTQQRELDTYVTRLKQSVDQFKAKTPLLAKAWSQDAAQTEQELYKIAYDLSVANNGWAEPAQVLTTWEANQKALLKRLGYAVADAPKVVPAKQAKSVNPAKPKGNTPTAIKDVSANNVESDEDKYRSELRKRLRGSA